MMMDQRRERGDLEKRPSSSAEMSSSAVLADEESAKGIVNDVVTVTLSPADSETGKATTSPNQDNSSALAEQPTGDVKASGAGVQQKRSVDSIDQLAVNTPNNGGAVSELPKSESAPLPAMVADSGIAVKSGAARVETLKSEYRLPNFTINKTSECKWLIPEGIRFGFDHFDSKEANVSVSVSDGSLHFTPMQPGEVRVQLPYNGGKVVTFCMTVNPDPWSLWEVNQPAETDIVFDHDRIRLDTNHKNLISENLTHFKVLGASRRGRSHERAGTFRDDDMGYWADVKTGRYLYIVADGAGSAKFSREGSRLAVEYVKAHANEKLTEAAWAEDGAFPKKTGKIGLALLQLAYGAMASIDSIAKADPEKKWEIRDFNTTLLLAAVNRSTDGSLRIVTFSIGDGAIATFNGESPELLCTPDGGEFSGGTYFLTTRSIWAKVHNDPASFYNARVHVKCVSVEEAKHFMLFLMTDGISDPWFETDAGLKDKQKWNRFVNELTQQGDNNAGLDLNDSPGDNAEKLWKWLYFKIPGNHDDRTLIMAYTTDEMTGAINNG